MFPSDPPTLDRDDNPLHSLIFPPSSDQNPTPKPCHPDPPFLFNLPTPFFNEDELPLNQIFFQTHLMMPTYQKRGDDPAQEKVVKPKEPVVRRRSNLGVVPRRRAGKKDRHSKICTAQGIRDRRMRLSLQVARKFFDLQDLLGFDKASKTIEWLFIKSKKAIRELTRGANLQASKDHGLNSECEALSGIDQSSIGEAGNGGIHQAVAESLLISVDHTNNCDEKEPESKARESRDKARARARSRAREKMIIKHLEHSGGSGYDKWGPPAEEDLQKFGFSPNPQFDPNSNRVSPYGSVFTSQELSDLGAIEKLLENPTAALPPSSSCPISDYLCSSGYAADPSSWLGFSGNWDTLSSERVNSFQYMLTNQAPSMMENPNSIYLATANLP